MQQRLISLSLLLLLGIHTCPAGSANVSHVVLWHSSEHEVLMSWGRAHCARPNAQRINQYIDDDGFLKIKHCR